MIKAGRAEESSVGFYSSAEGANELHRSSLPPLPCFLLFSVFLSVSENDQGKPQCGEDSQCFPEEGIICIAGLRCFSFLTAGRSLFGSPVFAAAVFAA